ncbi:hypothetical protein V2G26_006987 [Clonostachys chloroleuca]
MPWTRVGSLLRSSKSSDIINDIYNTTLGFEKIFVFGLPERTDRRDDAAVFGCWRAHMDVIQQVIKRNLNSALILEDDVDWDVGHCGMVMPPDGSPIPEGRVISLDESVPERRHLFSLVFPFPFKDEYPDHTRIVHHAKDECLHPGLCDYPARRTGAFQEIALKDVDDAVDMLLRLYCEGGVGRRSHTCLTVQPSLFNSHRPEGPMESYSNIRNWDGWQYEASTDMTRWSVRLNVDRLLDGRELWDQLPDQNED